MKPIFAKPPQRNRAAFQVREDVLEKLNTPWHFHEEYELTLIDYPHGKRIIGNDVDTFENQDLVLLGPNLPHSWKNAQTITTEKSRAIVIHFTTECFGNKFFMIPEMESIAHLLEKSCRGILVSGQTKKEVVKWMEEMLTTDGAQRLIFLLKILDRLTKSNDLGLLSSVGYWESVNLTDGKRMNSVYEHILNNFTKGISLTEIANLANISVPAFCRFFKLRTKKTFKEYLIELRINYACKLLVEKNFSVSQISTESGFNNLANFNRQFKEIKSITPVQYRREFLKVNI